MQRTTTPERHLVLLASSASEREQLIAARSDCELAHTRLLHNARLHQSAANLLVDAGLVGWQSEFERLSANGVSVLLNAIGSHGTVKFELIEALIVSGELTDLQLGFVLSKVQPQDTPAVLRALEASEHTGRFANPFFWARRGPELAGAIAGLDISHLAHRNEFKGFTTSPFTPIVMSALTTKHLQATATTAASSSAPPIQPAGLPLGGAVDATYVSLVERWGNEEWLSQIGTPLDLQCVVELLAHPCCTDVVAAEVLSVLAQIASAWYLNATAWWLHWHPGSVQVIFDSFSVALDHLAHITPDVELWKMLDASGRALLLDSLATSSVPVDCYVSLTDEEVGFLRADRVCDRLGEPCVADRIMATLEAGCGDIDSLDVAVNFVAGGFPGTIATALQVASVFFGEGKTHLQHNFKVTQLSPDAEPS